jgi:hypothetical protein
MTMRTRTLPQNTVWLFLLIILTSIGCSGCGVTDCETKAATEQIVKASGDMPQIKFAASNIKARGHPVVHSDVALLSTLLSPADFLRSTADLLQGPTKSKSYPKTAEMMDRCKKAAESKIDTATYQKAQSSLGSLGPVSRILSGSFHYQHDRGRYQMIFDVIFASPSADLSWLDPADESIFEIKHSASAISIQLPSTKEIEIETYIESFFEPADLVLVATRLLFCDHSAYSVRVKSSNHIK